jgi:uncharacterized protein with ParB-like and HNH nuclease domain
MSVSIHAIEKPLFKVFSNDFAFSIPAYQRPYAWTTDEASELLADLLSFLGDGSQSITDANPYFLGSIVLIKNENIPDSDVIDGQQRLTTLTILLSVLQNLVSSENSSRVTQYIYQEGNTFEGTDDRYRLKLRERDEKFFRKYIQDKDKLAELFDLDPSQLPDSQINIQANAKYFYQELQQIPEDRLEQFVRYLMTRCFLVIVSTPDLNSAYRIFSILNTRGLDLSLTDLLKSEIIGAIPRVQQEKYTKIWEDEEEDLGREAFQELFAHIRMIYRKAKLREAAFSEFRKHIKPEKEPEKFIDDVLKPYSEALEIIKKANYQSSQNAKDINSLFGWLNQIDNFDWVPPAILYLSQNKQTPDKLKLFFTDLERLAAGLMILRSSPNERIERYAKLLTEIEHNTDLSKSLSPLQLTTLEINEVIKTLDGNLYDIAKIRKYVLLRLDTALSEGEAIYNYKIVTVEHVLPQNPSSGSTWLEWFPSEQNRKQYVHRIGNLALLSRKKNSQAQNYDFSKKKEKYFTSNKGVSSFALTSQILQESEWTPQVINQRQENLMQKLKELWRL